MIVYDRPLLYDIAFSYRDTVAEGDGLLSHFEQAAGRAPASVLELACGPASHAIEIARRGIPATALDLSGPMCEFARQKASLSGVSLSVHQGDMSEFRLDGRFDLVLTMSNSIAHLHDLDSLLHHLDSVASHLTPDGRYVLEVLHPRHFLGRGPRPGSAFEPWTISRWGMEISTRWGSPGDPYDPIRQIFDATVVMKVRDDEGERTFTEVVRMKDWTRSELLAAIRLGGSLECVGIYGDPALSSPFTTESEAMVLVCRRREGTLG